jgi:hypothetical protein
MLLLLNRWSPKSEALKMVKWNFPGAEIVQSLKYKMVIGSSPGLPDFSWYSIPKQGKINQITIQYT